ncbi:hypothetical protein [Streptomyces sp. NPDC004726]
MRELLSRAPLVRELLSRGLVRVLSLVQSARGRPCADSPTPAHTLASPWTRPWPGPDKEEAQELLRRQAEARRQRRKDLYIAPRGIRWSPRRRGVTA